MAKPNITVERLRELLNYDSQTGVFTWYVRRKGVLPSRVAGSIKTNGYMHIVIDGRAYRAHRLAWLHFYGKWPTKDLDHKDECKTNNRISNLREVSESANGQNVTAPTSKNKTGVRGVHWVPERRRFLAQLMLDGKHCYRKYFKTLDEAKEGILQAKKKYHPAYIEKSHWPNIAA